MISAQFGRCEYGEGVEGSSEEGDGCQVEVGFGFHLFRV